jgi:hypothetical protein
LFVLDRPIRSVAGQTIPARERHDVAIFDPAQAAIQRCCPQRPIAIELKMLDRGLPQSMSGRARRAELPILEIRYRPVVPETEPHSAPLGE